mmetsp:Transcript_21466/g.47718  ORF Transcript_21466/g.47718 Transcript_21466/m.47718 type:complete len:229 (-) Transcript_21466:109-795(-)
MMLLRRPRRARLCLSSVWMSCCMRDVKSFLRSRVSLACMRLRSRFSTSDTPTRSNSSSISFGNSPPSTLLSFEWMLFSPLVASSPVEASLRTSAWTPRLLAASARTHCLSWSTMLPLEMPSLEFSSILSNFKEPFSGPEPVWSPRHIRIDAVLLSSSSCSYSTASLCSSSRRIFSLSIISFLRNLVRFACSLFLSRFLSARWRIASSSPLSGSLYGDTQVSSNCRFLI